MFVFCLLVDLVRLSVLVPVIDRKDFVSKLAYNGDVSVGEWVLTHSPTHSLTHSLKTYLAFPV